jgi:hypothetical protein
MNRYQVVVIKSIRETYYINTDTAESAEDLIYDQVLDTEIQLKPDLIEVKDSFIQSVTDLGSIE